MTNKIYIATGNVFALLVNLILVCLIAASYVDAYKAITDQDIVHAMVAAIVWMTVVLLVDSLWFIEWLRYNKRQARFRVFDNYSQQLR